MAQSPIAEKGRRSTGRWFHSSALKYAGCARSLVSHSPLSPATTIGHLCREVIQDFADALVGNISHKVVIQDKSKTINRIRATLTKYEGNLGETVKPFLEALLAYWGTVNDLIQRQEY